MGIFGKKNTCSICGGTKAKEVNDGFICDDCLSKCGYFKPIGQNFKLARVKDIENLISENKLCDTLQKERALIFNPNRIIGDKVLVDDEHKLWSPTKGISSKKSTGEIFTYDDVISFEVVEDGNSVTKGGIGRAVAGGLLLGGVGAVVGGATGKRKNQETCNRLFLKLKVKHFPRDILIIYISVNEVKKDSSTYKTYYYNMQQLLDFFNNAKDTLEEDERKDLGIADEIKKYHNLFVSGAITEEEFNSIKNKLITKL